MIEACPSIAKTQSITKLFLSLLTLCCLFLWSCRPPLEKDSETLDDRKANSSAQAHSAKDTEGESLSHQDQGKDKNDNVVVVLLDHSHIPLRVVQQSMLKMIAANYPSYQFIYLDAKGQSKLQEFQLRKSLENKAVALILFPIDCSSISTLLSTQNNLPPILSINDEGALASKSKSLSISGKEIASLADLFIRERISAKKSQPIDPAQPAIGKVAILHGSDTLLPQEEAILSELQKKMQSNSQLELYHIAPANWNEVDAASRMLEALRIHPELNIVICLNDAIAHGAYLAARQLGRQGDILFLGIDAVGGPSGGISLVKDQMLAASIRQPFLMKEINEQLQHALSDNGAKTWQSGGLASSESPEIISIANAYEMARKYDRAAEPEALGLK